MPAETAVGGIAVWDGREVLFLGAGGLLNSPSARGVAYNPATNRWTALPASPLRGWGTRTWCGPAAR
jgi:hypothetical protein